MDTYYATKMAAKTEAELLEYFHNHAKYVPEAVLAAVTELQNRGRIFTAAELATLEAERQAVKQAAEAAVAEEEISSATEMPRFYSPGAIFGFSIFFSLIFGAALLATNIRQIGNRKGGWVVVGFGLFYMLLEVLVRWQLKRSSGLSMAFDLASVAFKLAGAFILNYYFWPKYIGRQLAYEAKPIWRALLISIVSILIVLSLLVLVKQAFFPPPR